jgi:GTP-binding protein EngB required for normal cell division
MDQGNDYEDHIGSFIILGYSQSGKSSTINTIAGKIIAEQGNNRGVSVTTKSDLYSIKSNYLGCSIDLIDTPGFNDSNLSMTDKSIENVISLQLIESLRNNSVFKGFILTESLTADTIQILPNLLRLSKVIGEQVNNSIVILVTKCDCIEDYQEKFECIESLCKQKEICLVKWSNKKNLSPEVRVNQIIKLKEALNEIKPYTSDYMERLKQEIEEIAIDLASKQKIPTQEDIIDRAKQLAELAPDITVEKIEIREREIQIQVPGFRKKSEENKNQKKNDFTRALNWITNIFKKSELELYNKSSIISIQEPSIILDKGKPTYEAFIDTAIEQLKLKTFEDYIKNN